MNMATETDPEKEGYIPYPKPVLIPETEKEPAWKPQPVPTPA
jgi:hypothetical protein